MANLSRGVFLPRDLGALFWDLAASVLPAVLLCGAGAAFALDETFYKDSFALWRVFGGLVAVIFGFGAFVNSYLALRDSGIVPALYIRRMPGVTVVSSLGGVFLRRSLQMTGEATLIVRESLIRIDRRRSSHYQWSLSSGDHEVVIVCKRPFAEIAPHLKQRLGSIDLRIDS